MEDSHTVRYGQKIRLATRSVYATVGGKLANDTDRDSGALPAEMGIGYYEKNGRHGILSCVPPLGDKLDHLFTEDEFLVLDPSGTHEPGDVVEYGHTLVLVNQHGMVWNNKTGGITGYVGPRPRGVPGEMFVAFRQFPPGVGVRSKRDKADKSAADKSPPVSTASSVSMAPMSTTSSAVTDSRVSRTTSSASAASDTPPASSTSEGGPVRFGDGNVAITVVESNRHSQMFNKRLSNFKKPTSHIAGGYICCDGKGTELRFAVWPAKPRVEQISMLNKLITSYSYGQKIALPLGLLESTATRTSRATDSSGSRAAQQAVARSGLQQAEICFRLSNQATAVLPGALLQQKLLAHAAGDQQDEPESVFELPLRNGPGCLVVRLTGFAPRKMMGKLATGKPLGTARRVKPGMVVFYRLTELLRLIPVPVFALLYAVLMHVLWGQLSSMEDGLRRELVVLVLVMLPAMYVAVKVDHPFSGLFQPPTDELEADTEEAAGGAYAGHSASGTLKLIVTEYRFSPVIAASSGTDAKGSVGRVDPATAAATTNAIASATTSTGAETASPTALEATGKVPQRFILAEKGDEEKARARYDVTTQWRREEGIDRLLEEPSPHFGIIKENYPHYYHKRGKQGEPVYYEKPGKINLKALKGAGLTLDDLMHNYLMITEFLWQVIEQDDNRKGISVLDVEGIGISDFAGEAVEYVRKAAAVSGQHYPERCAYIFVINVPSWFSMIWNTVKGMVDDVTREKVIIVRGKKKILEALAERIPMENIPVEYGGTSDGKSPEEDLLFNLMAYVNKDENAPASNPVGEILKQKPIKH